MKRFLVNSIAIFRRELASYFFSPIAYVVICLFVLTNGWVFYVYAKRFQTEQQQIQFILGGLFGWVPFWTLFLSPIITMRSFAEEKRSGTMETLMTAPVTEAQVVAGKFLAAEAFFLMIWLTLLLHVLILSVLGNPDLGPVLAVYLGVAALGCATNGLGLLASAMTRNQIIAVIVAFIGNLLLVLVEMLRQLFPPESEADRFFDFIGVSSHFSREYSRGVVDLRFLALYLFAAGLFLYLTTRVLARRGAR